MYICIYVYMYICIYVYMCICVYVYMYMYMYICICICFYIYTCLYAYVQISVDSYGRLSRMKTAGLGPGRRHRSSQRSEKRCWAEQTIAFKRLYSISDNLNLRARLYNSRFDGIAPERTRGSQAKT